MWNKTPSRSVDDDHDWADYSREQSMKQGGNRALMERTKGQ
jgi:hypothetical protein